MERAVYAEMAALDEAHWWFRGRRRIVATLLTRLGLPQGARRIVEIGCGTGANLSTLDRFGDLTGVEPDAEARAHATRRSSVQVLPGHLPDGVPVADGSADLVVMLDVLEHVGDDVAALKAVREKLGPDARVLITVPALPMLWSSHDEAHHHHRRYTARTLRAALVEAGLTPVLLSHFNTLLFPLIALARLAKALTGDKGADTGLPSGPVNRMLEAIFASERHALGRVPMPIGVSLVAVARRA